MNSEFSLRKVRAPKERLRRLRRAAPGCNGLGADGEGLEAPHDPPGLQKAFHHRKEHPGEYTGPSLSCRIRASLASILSVSTFLCGALLRWGWEMQWEGKSLDRQHRSATRARGRWKTVGKGRYLLHCCCFQTCPSVKVPFRKTSCHSLWCSLQLSFIGSTTTSRERSS